MHDRPHASRHGRSPQPKTRRPASRWDLSTLRELWRFKDYGRPERSRSSGGVLMNGGEMAASLAAPWPLALVIDDLLQGQGQGQDRDAAHRRRVVRRHVDGDAAGRGERRAGDHRRLRGCSPTGRHVHERSRPADHVAHPRGRVRLHPAAADDLPRPADRRRADQPSRLRHLDGGIDPAGCVHRPHPVRAHPGRHRRGDGRGGLAPRADRARRRPAGVPDRQATSPA